jgi:hypothetical protein
MTTNYEHWHEVPYDHLPPALKRFGRLVEGGMDSHTAWLRVRKKMPGTWPTARPDELPVDFCAWVRLIRVGRGNRRQAWELMREAKRRSDQVLALDLDDHAASLEGLPEDERIRRVRADGLRWLQDFIMLMDDKAAVPETLEECMAWVRRQPDFPEAEDEPHDD